MLFKRQIAILMPIILVLAIGVKLLGRMVNQAEKDLTTPIVFYTDDVKQLDMTQKERQLHGGETAFLKTTMFNNPEDYELFPLAQKKGKLLGKEQPTKTSNIVPKADFSTKTATKKTFYKLEKVTEKSNLAYCNKIVCMSIYQRSNMGKIRNRAEYLTPNDIGHEEEFVYSFPYTIKTKEYGVIPYTCFATKGNSKLDVIFENYMKSRRRKPIRREK